MSTRCFIGLSPRDRMGPTLRILLLPPHSLPPVHQASGLTSAMCRPLPRSVLGGEVRVRWSALSWSLSFFVVVVIFNPRIVLDLRQRQQVGEMCLAL